MIPGTKHTGTLTGKIATGAIKSYNKLAGKTTESILNKSPNEGGNGDSTKTDGSVNDEVNKQHKKTPEKIKSQSSKDLKEGRASFLNNNENSKIMQEKVFKENSNI